MVFWVILWVLVVNFFCVLSLLDLVIWRFDFVFFNWILYFLMIFMSFSFLLVLSLNEFVLVLVSLVCFMMVEYFVLMCMSFCFSWDIWRLKLEIVFFVFVSFVFKLIMVVFFLFWDCWSFFLMYEFFCFFFLRKLCGFLRLLLVFLFVF